MLPASDDVMTGAVGMVGSGTGEWPSFTDDVLAEHRVFGMVVHRPAARDALDPRCRTPGEFHRYGAWVVKMEVGRLCTACFPTGVLRG